MKKLLFVFMALSLFACKQEKASDSLVFSGQIKNPNRTGIVLMKGDFNQEIKLDENGNFIDTLIGIEEGIYTLWDSVESTKLYLIPGQDLSLNMDASQFDESIVYDGPGAAASNFLAQYYLFDEKLGTDFKALYSMEEAGFLSQLDSISEAKSAFLAGFESLPTHFMEMQQKNIDYERLQYISNYQNAHRYYTKNDSFEVSEAFLAPLSEIDMNDEASYKNIQAYQRLVMSHYGQGDMLENIAGLGAVSSELIRNDVIRNIQYGMRPGSDQLDTIYKGLRAMATDEELIKKLDENYTKYLTLAKGKPSPTFSYPDTEGNAVSLADLLGKVVYIDVWATWCGPCRAEIPYLKELAEEYKDRNVAFVSISIDKEADKDKWLAMVAEKELKGYQIFADKDWESDFVQDYGIQGIPRFILVDMEGNIASPDASRPSSGEEIRELLDQLGA